MMSNKRQLERKRGRGREMEREGRGRDDERWLSFVSAFLWSWPRRVNPVAKTKTGSRLSSESTCPSNADAKCWRPLPCTVATWVWRCLGMHLGAMALHHLGGHHEIQPEREHPSEFDCLNQQLCQAHEADVSFLKSHHVMDYSVLAAWQITAAFSSLHMVHVQAP